MTEHDEMCTCDRCMREDHDRTLQRVGDLEREVVQLRAENERLRVLVGRAPHARHCEAGASIFPGPCNCWKADVDYEALLTRVRSALGERGTT
jgi:hypothetical protein